MKILSAFVSGISNLADGVREVADAASQKVAQEAGVSWGAPQAATAEIDPIKGLSELWEWTPATFDIAWDGQERSNGNMDHIDGATQHGQRPEQSLVLSA